MHFSRGEAEEDGGAGGGEAGGHQRPAELQAGVHRQGHQTQQELQGSI